MAFSPVPIPRPVGGFAGGLRRHGGHSILAPSALDLAPPPVCKSWIRHWLLLTYVLLKTWNDRWFMSTTHSIIITTRCTKLLRVSIYASTSRTAFHSYWPVSHARVICLAWCCYRYYPSCTAPVLWWM